MPCKNKVRINAYLGKQEYSDISKWAKEHRTSVSSLIVMLCNNFLSQENNGENTYTLTNKPKKPSASSNKVESSYEDYINDSTRPDYNWLDAALYNLEHNTTMEI